MATPEQMPEDLKADIQRMIDAGEPDENIGRAIDMYKDEKSGTGEQTIKELKGTLEGILPGAWGAIRGTLYDLPVGLYKDLNSVLKGQTPEYAKNLVDGLASLPSDFMQGTHEERGKIIGNLLGSFGVAKFAPGSPKAAARGIGSTLEATGKKGGWPLRMVGSHALGSGNPLGAALIAAPEVLQSTGRSIREWGENTPARIQSGIDKFYGGTKAPSIPAPAQSPIRINTTPDVVDRALSEQSRTPATGGGGLSAAERKALVKQGYSAEMIDRMDKNPTPGKGGTRISPAPLRESAKPITPKQASDLNQTGRDAGIRFSTKAEADAARPGPDVPLKTRFANEDVKANAAVRGTPADVAHSPKAQAMEAERQAASGTPLEAGTRRAGVPEDPATAIVGQSNYGDSPISLRGNYPNEGSIPDIPESAYANVYDARTAPIEDQVMQRVAPKPDLVDRVLAQPPTPIEKPSTITKRTPGNLVLSPEDIQFQENRFQAGAANRRYRGGLSAERGMKTTLPGEELDPMEQALIKRRMLEDQE